MNIFKKKRKIEIVVPFKDRYPILAFAKEHGIPFTTETFGNTLAHVTFATYESWSEISAAFMKKFKDVQPRVRRKTMFCC